MLTRNSRFLPGGNLGTAAAIFSAKSGLSCISRRWRPASVCVLTFHGVRDEAIEQPDLLDVDQHVPVAFFEQIAEHLARNYQVVSAAEIVRARRGEAILPERAVALTFDDGYASNYLLAYPILNRLGLPATIFLTTAYVDQLVLPWFVRLELALARTRKIELPWAGQVWPLASKAQRQLAYAALCGRLKAQSTPAMVSALEEIERLLECQVLPGDPLPAALQPMSWEMAREMQASGLIELGGHTHTHPVLGRSDIDSAEREILTCAARMRVELGRSPQLFAYPNGLEGDFNEATKQALGKAGFEASFTMQAGFVHAHHEMMALPRYGSPESHALLEAMVSGCMERLRQARGGLGLRRAHRGGVA